MKGLILATLVTLLNSQAALVTEAQNQKWKVDLSPDKTFSVMVPKATTSVQPPDEKFRSCTIGERGLEGALRETIPRETRFGVIVINGRAEILRSLPRQEALEQLGLRFIGDDVEARFLRPGQKVRTRGVLGREYFYLRDSETPLFARGRIFDTGKQIYILVFRARDLKDLVSAEANYFFSSLRLLKRPPIEIMRDSSSWSLECK